MSKTKTLTEEERETSGWTLTAILLCVIAIWAVSGWLVNSTDTQNRGTFGDMFGAVNALFSGLAFATLIYTVFLQRRELQLQRKELEYTRMELTRSASAQEASEVALRAQAEASALSANLAAVNSLLTYCRQEITQMNVSRIYLSDSYEALKYQELVKREIALVQMLDKVFQEINQKTSAH